MRPVRRDRNGFSLILAAPALVRAAGLFIWRRWWARAVTAGLAPPWTLPLPANAALPETRASGAGAVSDAVCGLLRAGQAALNFPQTPCPDFTFSLGADGWLWRLTPAHLAWAALVVALLWAAARSDIAGALESPALRAGWQAAKAVGLALGVKAVAGMVVGWGWGLRGVAEVLQ